MSKVRLAVSECVCVSSGSVVECTPMAIIIKIRNIVQLQYDNKYDTKYLKYISYI